MMADTTEPEPDTRQPDTATQDGATPASVVDGLAVVLAAIEAGELVCPAATRHRIQGAVLALNALAGRPGNAFRDLLEWITSSPGLSSRFGAWGCVRWLESAADQRG